MGCMSEHAPASESRNRQSRRKYLKSAAYLGSSISLLGAVQSTTANPGSPDPDEEVGAGDVKKSYESVLKGGGLYEEHIGSAIEIKEESGTDTQLRVSGDWVIENTETGETPADSTNIGIGYQRIRIENKTPSEISIFTSGNSDEVAMSPKPSDHPNANLDAWIGITTAALSGAATIAGSYTAGLALSATNLSNSLYGLVVDADKNNDTYEWGGSHTFGQHKGGHHADFEVEEKTDQVGEIRVHSETANVTNSWDIKFDNGVKDISPVI